MMRVGLSLTLGLALVAVGCQAPKHSSFSPFSAHLESIPGSAAQYLVLINTSGRDLHNFRYSAYLYSELIPHHPLARNRPFKQLLGSGHTLASGQVMRFR